MIVLPLKDNYDKSLLNEQESSGEESSSYFDTNSMHFDTESNTISMYSDKNIVRTNSIKLPKKGFIKAPKIPSIMSRSNIASYINIGTPKYVTVSNIILQSRFYSVVNVFYRLFLTDR